MMGNPEMDEQLNLEQLEIASAETARTITELSQEFVTRDEITEAVKEAMPRSLAYLDDVSPAGTVLRLGPNKNVGSNESTSYWGKVVTAFNDIAGKVTLAVGTYIGLSKADNTITLTNKGVTTLKSATGNINIVGANAAGDGVDVSIAGKTITVKPEYAPLIGGYGEYTRHHLIFVEPIGKIVRIYMLPMQSTSISSLIPFPAGGSCVANTAYYIDVVLGGEGGAVDSVNGRTGAVTVSEFPTNGVSQTVYYVSSVVWQAPYLIYVRRQKQFVAGLFIGDWPLDQILITTAEECD